MGRRGRPRNPKNIPIRVFMIEDNTGDIRLIKEMLSEAKVAKFKLTSSKTLEEGLDQIESGGMDVLILDLGLPTSDGLNTLHSVKELDPDLPIVVLTGNKDEDTAIKAVREGAQDYLLKGEVDSRVLVRSLRYAIERKKLEIELTRARELLELKINEKTSRLQEKNIALKEILTHISEEKMNTRRQIANDIEQVLMPIMLKLKRSVIPTNLTLIELLENGLREIASASLNVLSAYSKLSPREIEICNMIKNGLTTKEIAVEVSISNTTVQKHRQQIRKKLGITNDKVNLRSFLLSLS
ncbi:response regulator transcription factor [bacterium]|nr:response regulator transcription factor [bacterium]